MAALRKTSPGRLQFWLGVLLTLGVLTGLVAGLTGHSAGSGTSELSNRAQPLLIEAEAIYSGLADADTTAAQAFLAGGLEPPALTARYNADLARATAALTSAARLTPQDSEAASAVAALSTGVAQYSALVATARANNRQGLPVGSSYLSAASELNRNTLLPKAQDLFQAAQAEVRHSYSSARSIAWWVVLFVLVVALLLVLFRVQRYLSRTTHRTYNVPLVAATLLTVVLALGGLAVIVSQTKHLGRSESQGSTPIAALGEARIQALRERGDEALTLAAHGSGSDSETDFTQATAKLNSLTTPELGFSLSQNQSYVEQHKQVRALDDGGDWDGAVKLALSYETTSSFDQLVKDIGDELGKHETTFGDEIDAAGHGLGTMTVLGPLLALLICALAGLGLRARLEEYR